MSSNPGKHLQTSNNSNCTVSLRYNASQAAISQVCSVAQSWLKSLGLGRLGTLSYPVFVRRQNQFQAMRPSSQVPFGTANLPTALKKCQSSRRFVWNMVWCRWHIISTRKSWKPSTSKSGQASQLAGRRKTQMQPQVDPRPKWKWFSIWPV